MDWHLKPWRVTSPGCNVGGSTTLKFDLGGNITINPGGIVWGTFVYTGPDTAKATADGIAHTIECIAGSPRVLRCHHLEEGKCHPQQEGDSCITTISWTAMEGTGMRAYEKPDEGYPVEPRPGTAEGSGLPSHA